jgi:type I restriction enzyme S subunit
MPADWEVRAIESLGSVRGGKRLPKGRSLTDIPTSHPYLRVTDMRPGGVDTSDVRYVPNDVAPSIRAYRIFKDDIFISVAGTLGIVGRIPTQLDGANLTENADRITSINCDVDYLMYSLLSEPIQREVEALRTVGAQPKLALGRIKRFEIVTPKSRDEQSRIAGVLRDTDRHLTALERMIAKKQAIKHGMMQQLLTGSIRLAGFSEPWREVRLGDCASMGSGGTPPSGMSHYYGGDIRWVSISDMTRAGRFVHSTENTLTIDGLNHSAAKLYPPGVVLYAMYASLGECAIAVGRVSSSQAILGIEPSRALDRDFLYSRLVSMKNQVREMGQQGTQSNLNAGMVRDFRIDLPQVDEQRAIARVLGDADDELELHRTRLRKALDIKQGMMQELLTGRARVLVDSEP